MIGFSKRMFLHKRFCAKLWQRQGIWYDPEFQSVYTCLKDIYILRPVRSINKYVYFFLKQNFWDKGEAVTLAAAMM